MAAEAFAGGFNGEELLNSRFFGRNYVLAVRKGDENTPLTREQIIRIIDVLGSNEEVASKRISKDASTLIFDLVDVSKGGLSLQDLGDIADRLAVVPGINSKKNSSYSEIDKLIKERSLLEGGVMPVRREDARAVPSGARDAWVIEHEAGAASAVVNPSGGHEELREPLLSSYHYGFDDGVGVGIKGSQVLPKGKSDIYLALQGGVPDGSPSLACGTPLKPPNRVLQ